MSTTLAIVLALVMGYIAGIVTAWYVRKRGLADKVDKKP